MSLPARSPALGIGSRCAGGGGDRAVVAGVCGVVTDGVAVKPVRDEHRDAGDESADHESQCDVDDDPTSCHCRSPGDFLAGTTLCGSTDIRMPGPYPSDLSAPSEVAGRAHVMQKDPLRVVEAGPVSGVRVLILTTFEADEYVYQALRAGASGFLVKDTEPAELLQAVRIIARGDSLLSPSITRRLIAAIAARPEAVVSPTDLSELTDREREVLTLVGGGLTNDEIAERLFLSPLTAKTHVSRIMSKLSARDRAQLVVTAYETGLVRAGSQR
jgi:DNA-binding NarL/FixJ family response regulator